MSSNFIYAREAIEAVCNRRFPEFNDFRWPDVTPSDLPNSGPGFSSDNWQSVATEIVLQFNVNLKPHKPITITAAQKNTCHSKRLIEFQLLLSAKADEKIAKFIISSF